MRGVLETLDFDRVYGAWWERVIPEDGKTKVLRSADRYLAALSGILAPGAGSSVGRAGDF